VLRNGETERSSYTGLHGLGTLMLLESGKPRSTLCLKADYGHRYVGVAGEQMGG